MDRKEFLDILNRNLYGKIDAGVLTEHIRYYETYISSGMENGKTEQEILEELGDPRLIAKTILDASKKKSSANGVFEEEKEMEKKSILEGWKSKLIVVVILLVILLICIFVFHLVLMALPFILIAAGILWLIKKFEN